MEIVPATTKPEYPAMTTDEQYWNVRGDFPTAAPQDVIAALCDADDANRAQSLTELPDEIGLVDEGLALYLQCLRDALLAKDSWSDDVELRASLSVLAQLFNTLLAWRQLAITGYLSEARLFTRFVHESLVLALGLTHSGGLAEKFLKGNQISVKAARMAFARRVGDETKTVVAALDKHYRSLSKAAHPSAETMSLRTARTSPSHSALAKAIPEGVMYGGLLSNGLARASFLGLARNVEGAVRWIAVVITETSGTWATGVEDWRRRLQTALDAEE